MSYSQNNTNPNSVQPPRTTVEAALTQHFNDLSQAALYWYHVLANAMQRPPALPAGCLADQYLAECLLSHLRQESPEIQWPKAWGDLTAEQVTAAMLAKLQQVARSRIFVGTCKVCQGWQEILSNYSTPKSSASTVGAYLSSKKTKGLAPDSLKLYNSVLSRFAKTCPELPLKPEPIEKFLAQFSCQRSTRRTCYRILKRFYKFLAKRNEIPDNPMESIDTPKAPHKVIESLGPEELGSLLETPLSPRDRAAVLVMVGCGVRQGEARSLTFRDVRVNSVKVNGKTGERIVSASPKVVEALLALQNHHNDDEPIFWGTHPTQPLGSAGFELLTKKAFQKAGITGRRASPHTLRHTFGRICVVNGMDISILKELMGHASITTTEKYLCFAQKEIDDKYKLYAPLSHLTSDHRLTLPDDRLLPADDQLPL